MLFNTWKTSGANPYCLYNDLSEDYRPLRDPSAAPRPPRFPERLKAFMYACGQVARAQQREDLKEQAQAIGMVMAKALS